MKKILFMLLMVLTATVVQAYDVNIDGFYYNLDKENMEAAVTGKYPNNKTYLKLPTPEYTGDIVVPKTIEYDGETYTVTEIGKDAFESCTGLTSITLPETIRVISDNAFDGCTGITSITLPESLETIEREAFQSCEHLKAVNIPEGVKSIGVAAFKYCYELESINLPESLTKIYANALAGCHSLRTLHIPAGVTYLGGSILEATENLVQVTVDEDNPVYDSRDNCNGIIETASNRLFAATTITRIPESVTNIRISAFSGLHNLYELTIPASVLEVEHGFVFSCNNLKDVYSYSETLPTNSILPFGDYFYKEATLHVPAELLELYKSSTPCWCDFKEIVPIETTAVRNIDCADALAEECYSPDGQITGRGYKGIGIIRKADGSVSKRIIK